MTSPVTLATHEWPPAQADAGAAAPVAVLVHGVTGWHRTWWRVGPALAHAGWRVIAVDQRGHGRSPRIAGHAGVAEWTADLAAAIEGIGAPADVLIGHSLGAAVSAELAYLRPELVRRLVLEDPPALTRADDTGWQQNLEREMLDAHADFDGEVARELAANPRWQPEDARQDVEGKQLADRDGLLASFRRETGARVPALVQLITVPTLYVLGDEQRSVYRGDARRRLAHELPPNARLAVADAGHTIHRDQFEWYMATVVDWLRSTSEPPDR
ncbi:MAG TPA: alpha/beta fold hydrolase [Candidatus Limnocylindria bacterium]|nr:alpha/beta fold hydrolase [Candidatus Limnocylindria bacterium]